MSKESIAASARKYYLKVKDNPARKAKRAGYEAARRARNPQVKEYNRVKSAEWKGTHQERALFLQARFRAKKRGLQFTMTMDDVRIPEMCPVLGIPLFVGQGKRGPNSPSIDRIDPTKGYITGNVMVISWRANDLKADATVDEIRALAKFMGVA